MSAAGPGRRSGRDAVLAYMLIVNRPNHDMWASKMGVVPTGQMTPLLMERVFEEIDTVIDGDNLPEALRMQTWADLKKQWFRFWSVSASSTMEPLEVWVFDPEMQEWFRWLTPERKQQVVPLWVRRFELSLQPRKE